MPAKTKDMLTMQMSQTDAFALVKSKKVSLEAYEEWCAAKDKVGSNGAKRRQVPSGPQISKEDLHENAKGIVLDMGDGQRLTLDVRDLSSGSYGWGFYGKTSVVIDGKPIKIQCSISLTVANSKGSK